MSLPELIPEFAFDPPQKKGKRTIMCSGASHDRVGE